MRPASLASSRARRGLAVAAIGALQCGRPDARPALGSAEFRYMRAPEPGAGGVAALAVAETTSRDQFAGTLRRRDAARTG
jgi:hypothetical protein